MPIQKTYTCRCGKKHPMLTPNCVKRKCGCGRTASLSGSGVKIHDKGK